MGMGAVQVQVEGGGRRRRSCDDAGRAAEGVAGKDGSQEGEHIYRGELPCFIIVRFHVNASSSVSVARTCLYLTPFSMPGYRTRSRCRPTVPSRITGSLVGTPSVVMKKEIKIGFLGARACELGDSPPSFFTSFLTAFLPSQPLF